MRILAPLEHKILHRLWQYKFLTARQLLRSVGNKSLQSIYENLRALEAKALTWSIVYGGVSREWTMQKLHYLTRKGAMTLAEINRMEISQIKYPKSTNTLVKNDFFHRITTIDLMIAYEERVGATGCTPLFFDHYFDTNSSQVKNGFQCKTRIALGSNEFISPDCIFAHQHEDTTNLFILEISNGLDTKRIIEQLAKNLTASYKWLVGEKYDLPHTATILIAVEYPEMVQNLLKRIEQEPQLQKFSQREQYIYIGVQSVLKDHRATGRVDMSSAPALLFAPR